jgi:hypothetical protein
LHSQRLVFGVAAGPLLCLVAAAPPAAAQSGTGRADGGLGQTNYAALEKQWSTGTIDIDKREGGITTIGHNATFFVDSCVLITDNVRCVITGQFETERRQKFRTRQVA